jgi:hypothetical protein
MTQALRLSARSAYTRPARHLDHVITVKCRSTPFAAAAMAPVGYAVTSWLWDAVFSYPWALVVWA